MIPGLGSVLGVLIGIAAGLTVGSPAAPSPSRPSPPPRPLAGVTIALDPGHQLGNHRFPGEVDRLVDAGGLRKPCNTTGGETLGGVPEATIDFEIAVRVKARLERLGARVPMTRTRNSESAWGPCVDERGRFASRAGAALLVSLHADGTSSGEDGFHVIVPRDPVDPRIEAPSRALATSLRSALVAGGVPRSSYISQGLSVRSDLGTLNLARVPAVMVEMGNMRNRADALRLTGAEGQERYAAAIVSGVRRFLSR